MDYTPDEIAHKIANDRKTHSGHDGFKKHVKQQKEFRRTKQYGKPVVKITSYGRPSTIKSRVDYKHHIYQTITDKNTRCFKALDLQGREVKDVFYNRKTNTIVIVNRAGASTCFRPKEGGRYFVAQLKKDRQLRKDYGRGKTQLVKGGYYGLYANRDPRYTAAKLAKAGHDKEGIYQGLVRNHKDIAAKQPQKLQELAKSAHQAYQKRTQGVTQGSSGTRR